MPQTLTLRDMLAELLTLTQQNKAFLDYKVYLSSDSEGNGFSTLKREYSFQVGEGDKIMTIMPYEEGLQDEDIAPIENKRIMKIIHEELGGRKS